MGRREESDVGQSDGGGLRLEGSAGEEGCSEARDDKAKKELAFMVGATVIDVEPHDNSSYELSTIRIQTKDGKIIEFEAEGWEERYIGWEKIKDG